MSEWSKETDSKSVVAFSGYRGFESLSFREIKELLHKSVLRIGSTHQTTTEQDFGPALCIKTAGRSQNPALRDRISPWQEWNIHLRISWPAVLS